MLRTGRSGSNELLPSLSARRLKSKQQTPESEDCESEHDDLSSSVRSRRSGVLSTNVFKKKKDVEKLKVQQQQEKDPATQQSFATQYRYESDTSEDDNPKRRVSRSFSCNIRNQDKTRGQSRSRSRSRAGNETETPVSESLLTQSKTKGSPKKSSVLGVKAKLKQQYDGEESNRAIEYDSATEGDRNSDEDDNEEELYVSPKKANVSKVLRNDDKSKRSVVDRTSREKSYYSAPKTLSSKTKNQTGNNKCSNVESKQSKSIKSKKSSDSSSESPDEQENDSESISDMPGVDEETKTIKDTKGKSKSMKKTRNRSRSRSRSRSKSPTNRPKKASGERGRTKTKNESAEDDGDDRLSRRTRSLSRDKKSTPSLSKFIAKKASSSGKKKSACRSVDGGGGQISGKKVRSDDRSRGSRDSDEKKSARDIITNKNSKTDSVSVSSSSSSNTESSSDNKKLSKNSRRKSDEKETNQIKTESSTSRTNTTLSSTKSLPQNLVPYENTRKSIELVVALPPIPKPDHMFDVSRWRNPILDWRCDDRNVDTFAVDGIEITIPALPQTDLWKYSRDEQCKNPIFSFEPIYGDYDCFVHVSGNFNAPYQKAGIAMYIDDSNWVFTGMEYRPSAVQDNSTKKNLEITATNIIMKGHSDWTCCRLPTNAKEAGVWFNLKKIDDGCYETYYSYNGVKWVQMRHGLFHNIRATRVGVIVCSPSQQAQQFEGKFTYYTMRKKER